jgi:hypothetical protein
VEGLVVDHFENHKKWCKDHPIQSWWLHFRMNLSSRFIQSWLGKKYFGGNYSCCPISNEPERIEPCWQVRFYIWRMRKAGFNPLYYTWYMGEHTLIFATKEESHRAYQKYEEPDGSRFSAWWYGLDDYEKFPEDLEAGLKNWIEL